MHDKQRTTRFWAAAIMALLLPASVVYVNLPTASARPNHTIVVNSLADTSGGANCTLRDAIAAANSNAPAGGCAKGDVGLDTITFSVAGTITLSSSLPNISEDLMIDGSSLITIDGAAKFRNGPGVNNGISVNLNNLEFSNGNFSAGSGGSLSNLGSLYIANSTFSNNTAGFSGGALYSSGTLQIARSNFSGNNGGGFYGGALYVRGGNVSITNSTFANNVVQHWGGAIQVDSNATLNIVGTTFFSNTTAFGLSNAGGALSVFSGTVVITNTTFANNTSSVGGAFFIFQGNSGTAIFSNSTFAGNNAQLSGGAIRINGGTVSLKSSIVSNNSNRNCSGTPTDGGFNLQFGGGAANSCGATIMTLDPLLTPLGNHGGATQTFALLPGSRAIDQIPLGTNGCGTTISTDQRGVARPQGKACDIGAFELVFKLVFLHVIFKWVGSVDILMVRRQHEAWR